jgi:two-component system, chemotaxis family, protein-glutamate methylesterase/glutaminase
MLNPPRVADLALRRVEAVVIGASAGGIDALSAILPALPAETEFPVIVVVHVPRDRPSALVELFAPRCAVAAREAGDKEEAAGGTVWFAPSDYHLLVESDRTFSLSIEGPVHYSRPAIDPLFESAAAAYGPGLLGVVLTGGSADGARGAMAVRAAGGLLVVEDPESAEAPTMPAATISQVRPDAIGTIAEIAALLRAVALRRAR